MTIPTVESFFPGLMPFITQLAADYEQGGVTSNGDVAARVQAFFSPGRMARFDAVIAGWKEMAIQRDGATLIHEMSVLVALVLCPEYKNAAPDQQALLRWSVLFHDLKKVLKPGVRDHTHPFRGAAAAGLGLPHLGFPLVPGGESLLAEWAEMVQNARTVSPALQQPVQDNGRLPAILDGIHRIFGVDTPAALIVKTVLLHMSITNLDEFPQAAPLADADIPQVITPAVLPLLEIMMLVDSDAWTLFDHDTKARWRAKTLAVFARVRGLVDGSGG